MAGCRASDTSGWVAVRASGVTAVAVGWFRAASATAWEAAGELPRVNAAAIPARAAGAAAYGSRRLMEVLAELPKGLPPAKFALTRKAACTVHW